MAKFIINQGFDSEKTVESDSFVEKESFVIFANREGKEKIYAIPKSSVRSIERLVE